MSDRDSFLDEVRDEVRRDRLTAAVRRYGWIAALAVLAIVAAVAAVEWRQAQKQAVARDLGDAVLTALGAEAPGARIAALQSVDAAGDAAALRDMALAAEFAAEDQVRAAEILRAVVEDTAVAQLYRDLATLKLVMLPDLPVPDATKLQRLQPLTQAGRPLRLSALEQTAHVQIDLGREQAALATLDIIVSDAAASGAFRRRAQELIVALDGGGEGS